MADGALDSGLANANVELLDLLRPQNNHVFHVERMEKGLSYGICGGLVQNQPMILGSFPVSSCDEPKTDGLIFGTSGQPNLTFQEDSWFNYDASSIGGYEIQKFLKKYTIPTIMFFCSSESQFTMAHWRL